MFEDVTFACSACGFELQAEVGGASVDPETGDVDEADIIDELRGSDKLPECPECGADTEVVDSGGD